MKSIEGNFNKPEVNKLLISHFIELSSVYPIYRGHVLYIPGLKNPSIKFWSLWKNNQLIGCGALKFLDKEHCELKSIRVADSFRRKGKGFKVINHLINEAKELNIKKISLETGTGNFFTPARKLFDKCGFKVCEPFAHYKKDPDACYMSLLLSN